LRLPLAAADKKTAPFSPVVKLTERSDLSDLLHLKKNNRVPIKKILEIKSLIIDNSFKL
jgi:hypothetical protein